MRTFLCSFLATILLASPGARGRDFFDSPSPDGRFVLHRQLAEEADTLTAAEIVSQPAHEPVLELASEGITTIAAVWSADGTSLAVNSVSGRAGEPRLFRCRGDTFTELTVPQVRLPIAPDARVRRGRWVFDYLEPVRWLPDGDLLLSANGKVQLFDQPSVPTWLVYDYHVVFGVSPGGRVRVKSVHKQRITRETEGS